MIKNTIVLFTLIFLLCCGLTMTAQENQAAPEMIQTNDKTVWIAFNREVKIENEIHLNAKRGSGLLYIKDSDFSNGKIELELKGKNEKGRSFVGIAFHGQNDSTYEAIYFRPFN